MNDTTQILREIDKLDRIGIDGVYSMLTKGMLDKSVSFNKGVGLHPFQSNFIIACITAKKLDFISQLFSRINLMVTLEKIQINENETAWDKLINMEQNKDNTWKNNKRPENIGWALDDLLRILKID